MYTVPTVAAAVIRNDCPPKAHADAHTRIAARFVVSSLGRGVFVVPVPVIVSVLFLALVLVLGVGLLVF